MGRMKERLGQFLRRSGDTFRGHPMEIALAGAGALAGCYVNGSGRDELYGMLWYFPVAFLVVYSLSALHGKGHGRWFYRLSPLLWLPTALLPERMDWTLYFVTLVIAQCLYLTADRRADDRRFMEKALGYAGALAAALALSAVCFLLAFSLYQSISYIFEVGQGAASQVGGYLAYLAYLGDCPLLFLVFNDGKGTKIGTGDKLFHIAINLILSPALLAYAAVLYLYFLKILLTGSLPKGGVAFIASGFLAAAFLLAGCQSFLRRRYYDWFYRRVAWVALPALVMLWTGTGYRVWQYGFTEQRVYLVAVAAILTWETGLFAFRSDRRYLWAGYATVVVLAALTYLPGISARDIERASQTARGNWPMRDDRMASHYEYVEIRSEEPIDIRGYRTMTPLRSRRTSHNDGTTDTLYIYTQANDSLLYAFPLARFGGERLKAAGLREGDPIPPGKHARLLRVELDSATILLDHILLRKDSALHVEDVSASYYLKE